MKIKTIKGVEERSILTGMIVDSAVVGRIAAKWTRQGLFRSEWSNLVATWCVDFYRKFGKAPRKAIQSQYHRWAEKNGNPEVQVLVEKFLSGLSSDYKALKRESNSEFLLDTASHYFNRIRLERLGLSIEENLDLGEVEKASRIVENFTKVDIGMGATVKLLTDKESLQKAFSESKEALITYPGAIGRFFANHLQRDSFIAFLGPEKRGKSFWLLDLAWRGIEQRRKVAVFVIGDMSEGQVQLRYGTRAAQIPTDLRRPCRWPVALRGPKTRSSVARVTHKLRTFKKALSWQKAWRAYQHTLQTKVRSKESYLRVVVHPAGGISVDGINEQIKIWSQTGWTPDVCIIDYADNLDMPDGGEDFRHQNNAAWKKMRGLSQTWHMLVVTATQANAASYGDEVGVITRKNFSEDKRKLAHVTGMIGINQTSDEKNLGLYRLNWVLLREGEYSEYRCVHTAGCLPLANPAVLSTY